MRLPWTIARAPLAILVVGLLVWLVTSSPFGTHIERPVSNVSLVDVQSDAADLRTAELTLAEPERTEVEVAPEDVATAEEQLGESDVLDWDDDIGETEFPEDPVEFGESLLHLSIVRVGTGEQVAARVLLVRLSAPGNGQWSAGDQVQKDVHIQAGGEWLRDLPEGWYRVACYEQPDGTEDPEEFFIGPGRTEFTVVLPAEERRNVELVIFDEYGAQIESVHLRSKKRQRRYVETTSWMKKRSILKHGTFFSMMVGDPEFGNGGPGPILTAEEGVFFLGTITPATRGKDDKVSYLLEMKGMSSVELVGEWELGEDGVFSAVQVRTSRLIDALWLANGERPDPLKLRLRASCKAVQAGHKDSWVARTSALVEVEVAYPGHLDLEFTWAPAAGRLDEKHLELAAN